jgi:hypothetical protein
MAYVLVVALSWDGPAPARTNAVGGHFLGCDEGVVN